MKFIFRTILIISCLFSFLHLDSIAEAHHGDEDTHHQEETAHHCIVSCHASCHGMVSLNSKALIEPYTESSSFYSIYSFQYETPTLDSLFRPPISI